MSNLAQPESQVAKAVRQIFKPLRTANPEEIVKQWASGKTLKEIGDEYGVHRASVSEWIGRNIDKATREAARELHFETRLDEGLETLESVANDPDIARAREAVLRRIEWRASREAPARWGDRPTTAVQVNAGDGGVQLVVYGASGDTQSAIAVENPSQP